MHDLAAAGMYLLLFLSKNRALGLAKVSAKHSFAVQRECVNLWSHWNATAKSKKGRGTSTLSNRHTQKQTSTSSSMMPRGTVAARVTGDWQARAERRFSLLRSCCCNQARSATQAIHVLDALAPNGAVPIEQSPLPGAGASLLLNASAGLGCGSSRSTDTGKLASAPCPSSLARGVRANPLRGWV